MTKFQKWLIVYMENNGINNHQMATLLGVTEGMVSKYRRGLAVPRYNTLTRIVEKTGIKIEEIV